MQHEGEKMDRFLEHFGKEIDHYREHYGEVVQVGTEKKIMLGTKKLSSKQKLLG